MNVLVVGGDSMIGSELSTRLQAKGCRVFETTRRQQTISDNRIFLNLKTVPSDFAETLSQRGINYVVLCASITSSADCEDNPSASREVNVIGNIAVGKQFLALDTPVIFLSSSAIFDGMVERPTPEESPSPCSEYGRQKLLVEQALLQASSNTCILRLTKVLGRRNKLLEHWAKELQSRNIITPFMDASMAPIGLEYCSEVIFNIIWHKRCGVFHAGPSYQITYVEAAKQIAEIIDAPFELIAPTSGTASGVKVTANAILGGTISCSELTAPDPYAAIDEFFSHLN
jgi:dTDP-4-dehydrorhamnose reductase